MNTTFPACEREGPRGGLANPASVSRKILVLEDDFDLRDVLLEVLEEEGYTVQAAASSAQALRVGPAFAPDLLITDVRMSGMDGLACVAELRKTLRQFRCIVITGYADRDAPRRAMQGEADDYLRKPFELKTLVDTVQRVLEAPAERAGYQQMLGRLAEGARRFWQARERPQAERDREQLFRSLYVGIRSGDLTPQEALHVWDRLEPLEAMPPETSAQDYRLLLDTVAALIREDYVYHDKRTPEMVPRPLFQEFYRRIQGGEISPEQLRLAPMLRTLSSQDPEFGALRARVWAEPAQD